jgi:hypothetical protein
MEWYWVHGTYVRIVTAVFRLLTIFAFTGWYLPVFCMVFTTLSWLKPVKTMVETKKRYLPGKYHVVNTGLVKIRNSAYNHNLPEEGVNLEPYYIFLQ